MCSSNLRSRSVLCSSNTNTFQLQTIRWGLTEDPSILATSSIDELLTGSAPPPFANRMAWKTLQMEDPSCNLAITYKLKRSVLPRKNRDPDAQQYLTKWSLTKRDKILVVRTTDQYQSTPRERIIIPKDFVPSVVSQLHQSLKCPPMAQLSKVMERYFFGIGMGTAIADAKKYCYICTADRKFPDQLQVYQPVNQPKHPGICFNADVLERS